MDAPLERSKRSTPSDGAELRSSYRPSSSSNYDRDESSQPRRRRRIGELPTDRRVAPTPARPSRYDERQSERDEFFAPQRPYPPHQQDDALTEEYLQQRRMRKQSSTSSQEYEQRPYSNNRRQSQNYDGGNPSYRRNYPQNDYQRPTREFDGSRGGNQGFRKKPGYNNYGKTNPNKGEYFAKGKRPVAPYKKNTNAKTPPVYNEDPIDFEEQVRLNKYLSNSGVSSRREADELIRAGVVLVNGNPVTTLGTKVSRKDRVEVNGKLISPERKVYILLNKPRNCVTTTDDPQERQTVMNIVANATTERIFPVGRLDRNTTGVLLLTNDGELAAKLVHPSFMKKKIYHVWLDKEVTIEDMQRLAEGVELEDGEMHADAISYATEEDMTQVGIEIHSGKNRIVRRLFEALGYHVVKLDRVYFAGLTKKNLGRGKWRYLSQQEVDALKMGAFE